MLNYGGIIVDLSEYYCNLYFTTKLFPYTGVTQLATEETEVLTCAFNSMTPTRTIRLAQYVWTQTRIVNSSIYCCPTHKEEEVCQEGVISPHERLH